MSTNIVFLKSWQINEAREILTDAFENSPVILSLPHFLDAPLQNCRKRIDTDRFNFLFLNQQLERWRSYYPLSASASES
jgi:hypothetical protein